jgi:hypothetical protein
VDRWSLGLNFRPGHPWSKCSSQRTVPTVSWMVGIYCLDICLVQHVQSKRHLNMMYLVCNEDNPYLWTWGQMDAPHLNHYFYHWTRNTQISSSKLPPPSQSACIPQAFKTISLHTRSATKSIENYFFFTVAWSYNFVSSFVKRVYDFVLLLTVLCYSTTVSIILKMCAFCLFT